VQVLLTRWFGVEPEHQHGRHVWADCQRYPNGGEIYYDEVPFGPNSGFCGVYLPGGALAEWTPTERIDRTWDLFLCGLLKPTRCDLSADFHGHDLQLIDEVVESCKKRELCGPLTWEPRVQYGAGGKVTGRGVYCGSRESNHQTCIYDKGLELSKGKGKAGEYIRWEERFLHDAAPAAMEHLWAARKWELTQERQQVTRLLGCMYGDFPLPGMDGIAHSVVEEHFAVMSSMLDFREVRRGRDRHRSARERVAWFVALLGSIVPASLRACRRRYSTLESTVKWLQRCIYPTIRKVRELCGGDLSIALDKLGFNHSDLKRGFDQLVREFCMKEVAA
jgi:DNA relaxase NicK